MLQSSTAFFVLTIYYRKIAHSLLYSKTISYIRAFIFRNHQFTHRYMKLFLLFSIIISSSLFSFGQSFELFYNNSLISNGDTISFTSVDNNAIFHFAPWITNKSNQVEDVKVRKTETTVVAGSENFFSWVNCYQPNVYVTLDSVPMYPADTNKSFFAAYYSNGFAGTTIVLYTFFNIADSNDSVSVYGKYVAGSGVGIYQSNSIVKISNAFPNPAQNTFYIDYSIEKAESASIEVLNVSGSIVSRQSLQVTSARANIDISTLKNGIYFYILIVNGKRVSSEKLVIQR